MLTAIIPVFNEEKTIAQVLKKVLAQRVVEQVIVVDDGSRDETSAVLRDFRHPRLRVLSHPKNLGKGAAVRAGLKNVETAYVIVQDADLEYDPSQYKILLSNLGKNHVVYGSRIRGDNPKAYLRTYLGNILLTQFCNLLFGTNLTDSYTCYKVLPTKLAKSLRLQSTGFEIEAEITGKLAKRKVKIKEVPISYKPRSYEEGKKIKAKDAFKGGLTYLKIKLGL